MKTFEFTGETKVNFLGITLFRIRAIVNIEKQNVKIGDLGGWVSDDAQVSGNAWVYGNAMVCGNARVCGDARVCGNAQVSGNAWVYGNAMVYGDARVCGDAWVYGDAMVYGNAMVYGDARVCGDAWVYGNAMVYGDARVCGDAWVCGNSDIDNNNKWCLFSCFGSSNRTTTVFTTKIGIEIVCGCFRGDLKAFISEIKSTHGDSKYGREYMAMVELIKIKFGIEDLK